MLLPLVNDEKKFIAFWNAKAGCTAVKRWYLSTIGIDPDSVNPHKFLASKTVYLTASIIEQKYKNYYKFVVCRNPWRRLVSYYKNKKVAVGWKNKTWPIDVRVTNMNTENFTFEQIVELVYSTPDQFLEQHVRSQTSGLSGISFDKIVKLENFSSGMTEVCDTLRIDCRDFSNPNRTHETSNIVEAFNLVPALFGPLNMPSYECFYNERLKNMVAEKFKSDIEYFDYNFED
jgi:hypothetical protein